MSIIGHMDKRVELDKSIKGEDPKYNVALSMMASKVSYENEAFIRDTVENRWKVKIEHYKILFPSKKKKNLLNKSVFFFLKKKRMFSLLNLCFCIDGSCGMR